MLPERDAVPSRLERIGLYAGLVLAGALMWPIRGYLTDDTFIHLPVSYTHLTLPTIYSV